MCAGFECINIYNSVASGAALTRRLLLCCGFSAQWYEKSFRPPVGNTKGYRALRAGRAVSLLFIFFHSVYTTRRKLGSYNVK